MAYRLSRRKAVQKSVRRAALDQIDKAIAEVRDPTIDRHEAVHQVRKRCKKVRGLIRLVRAEFDDYKAENRFFRDAARAFSCIRDAHTIVVCLDELMDHFRGHVDRASCATVREVLAERRRNIAEDRIDLDRTFDTFLARMHEARARVEGWRVDARGFQAVEGGLTRTYRRSRKGLRRVCEEATSANLHEWRKRVKYHWYHLRLLRRLWPEMMAVHREAADQLAGVLGSDHDLSVLGQTLTQAPDTFGGAAIVQSVVDLIEERQGQLRATMAMAGERLFAEQPAQFALRIGAYWETWRGL